MMDELKQPLQRRGLVKRLWQRRPALLATAFAALFAAYSAGGAWLMHKQLPFAGEPVVMAEIPPLEVIHSPPPKVVAEAVGAAQAIPQPMDTESIQTAATDEAPPMPQESKPKITKLDSHITIISNARPILVKAPVAAITEDTPQGPLPRIASNGAKASQVYAKPTSLTTLSNPGPKIVLILGGMGLSEKLTRRAVNDLPADVTLAFAPYGNNLQAQVDRARDSGHEVMLQLPMEPVGYPANNPGPKTLLADGDPAANADSLTWLLSRFAGYVGVTNYMGGRYMAAPTMLRPMLSELKRRGVQFIEDGSLPASAIDQVASSVNMPIRHAAVVIDQAPDAGSIANALDQLEKQAQDGGIAIGTGTGLDVTIDAVRDWLQEAQGRGVVIVPATAAFKGKLG